MVNGDWDEERMDRIGQNGNCGDHYEAGLFSMSEDAPVGDVQEGSEGLPNTRRVELRMSEVRRKARRSSRKGP